MTDEWTARADRPGKASFLGLRLSDELERLRRVRTWRTNGRNAITLAKTPTLRVVLLLLGEGTRISEHQAAGPLTFHVLSGSVTFRAGDGGGRFGPGELIALGSGVAHEVEALEESACLLTLAERPRTGGRAMPRPFKVGDHVSWNSEAGRVSGIIRKKIRAPIEFRGYTVRASRETPQYLIESDRTNHLAVHKGSALRKLGGAARARSMSKPPRSRRGSR